MANTVRMTLIFKGEVKQMSEMKVDWQEVDERNPQGYLELNNGQRVVHGPIKSVKMNDSDMVIIELEWAAEAKLSGMGLPDEWTAIESDKPFIIPNGVPFTIQDTPEKGQRIMFHGMNILYFDKVEGLDPKKVRGLELT